MVQLSEKSIEEFRHIFKEEYGKDLTKQEAFEAAHNLVGLFDLLFKIDAKERERQDRLKDEPKGFHVTDGEYNCRVCYTLVTGNQSWYDKFGVKCPLCQRATEKGIIPPEVFSDKDNWYAMWQLQDKFGIHSATARKMVRTGELKARIVETEEGKPYFYVFLKKENPILKEKKKNE